MTRRLGSGMPYEVVLRPSAVAAEIEIEIHDVTRRGHYFVLTHPEILDPRRLIDEVLTGDGRKP